MIFFITEIMKKKELFHEITGEITDECSLKANKDIIEHGIIELSKKSNEP